MEPGDRSRVTPPAESPPIPRLTPRSPATTLRSRNENRCWPYETPFASSDSATFEPRTSITWTALAMMTVGSVGYLGSAPASAVYGFASVFLYVLPAFVFLIPVSLVAADLGLGLGGRRLQLGARRRLRSDGPARRVV